jgi:hypothetical protein
LRRLASSNDAVASGIGARDGIGVNSGVERDEPAAARHGKGQEENIGDLPRADDPAPVDHAWTEKTHFIGPDLVMIDGELTVAGRSQQTPPPERGVVISG